MEENETLEFLNSFLPGWRNIGEKQDSFYYSMQAAAPWIPTFSNVIMIGSTYEFQIQKMQMGITGKVIFLSLPAHLPGDKHCWILVNSFEENCKLSQKAHPLLSWLRFHTLIPPVHLPTTQSL